MTRALSPLAVSDAPRVPGVQRADAVAVPRRRGIRGSVAGLRRPRGRSWSVRDGERSAPPAGSASFLKWGTVKRASRCPRPSTPVWSRRSSARSTPERRMRPRSATAGAAPRRSRSGATSSRSSRPAARSPRSCHAPDEQRGEADLYLGENAGSTSPPAGLRRARRRALEGRPVDESRHRGFCSGIATSGTRSSAIRTRTPP